MGRNPNGARAVCTENSIRVDDVTESPKLAEWLLCFVLAVLASPFKSKLRLEAENAVLRHQLIVLRRKLRGRVQFANSDLGYGFRYTQRPLRRDRAEKPAHEAD